MRRGWESNPRMPDHKSNALTTEPRCSTSILYSGFPLTHKSGDEMCINSLSQGLKCRPAKAGIELGPVNPKAERLPLDHTATKAIQVCRSKKKNREKRGWGLK
ncbi:hypothetical protein ElyMa_002677100 [Elysia marginata]|uniref:Uncharacterized protein n=1 Tax=Elysia marginata TaxID=1093978 RepID=A0AAV4HDF4_9GAST|nr:hypothetical protein ElyMa_002677100 [Elysia marginata]